MTTKDINTTNSSKANITYESAGVNYDKLDQLKINAQKSAVATQKNSPGKISSVEESRGESAFVWKEGEFYKAMVIEGLGTKSLVTEEVFRTTGKSFYKEIAQDTVATIINDLIVVGARPLVLNAYFGLGDSNWLNNFTRAEDLVNGWSEACAKAEVIWGGGETPSLSGIINPESIDLAGSAVGIIDPPERLTLGNRISDGDSILFIEGNGIHANGLSIVRKIVSELQDKEPYNIQLPSGTTLGESILRPTPIYSKIVDELFSKGINIHYMINVTGHGLRKIMRAKGNFKYRIDQVPKEDELFEFIQEKSGMSNLEMYGTFNMGVGFAIIVESSDIDRAIEIVNESKDFKAFKAGYVERVEEGKKQVHITPLDLLYTSDSLNIRVEETISVSESLNIK